MKKSITCGLPRNKKGSTLLTVVVLFLFFMVIVMTGAVVTQANIKRATVVNAYSSSYYVAETGLNEFSDRLSAWLETSTVDYSSNPQQLALDFLSYLGSGTTITYDDTLMGKAASTAVDLVYVGLEEGVPYYLLSATGFVGEESRTLTRALRYQGEVGEVEIGFDTSALYLFNYYGEESIIETTAWDQTFKGPIVTNKQFDLKHGMKLIGPFVTNNEMNFTSSVSATGAIITSGLINFRVNSYSIIQTLVLKPGARIHIDVNWSPMTISNFLLPIGTNFDDVVTFVDSGNSKAIVNGLKQKAIYYNPNNFDPWDTAYYQNLSISPIAIFGDPDELSNAGLAGYFADDFILDNLDDEHPPASYLPKVTLEFPDITKYPMYSSINPSSPYVNGNRFSVGGIQSGHEVRLELDRSYSFEGFYLSDGYGTFTIDVGDHDISIVTTALHLKGTVRVVGSGSLKIYVVGVNDYVSDLNLEYNLFTKVGGNFTDLQLFINRTNESTKYAFGKNSLNLADDEVFKGIVYAENMNVVIANRFHAAYISPNATVFEIANNGTGEVVSPLVFIPKGTIELTGKLFDGAVVASNLNFGTFGDILFHNELDNDLMQEIFGPVVSGSSQGGNSGGSQDAVLDWGATIEKER